MALFEWNKDNLKDGLVAVERTEFSGEQMRERTDLQPRLRDKPEAIEPDLFIVAEEYSNSDCRIDLLGLDKEGNIVVIELKRKEDKFMDLQAIRYAALVSTMTFNDLVKAHSEFLAEREKENAEEAKSPEELTEESHKKLLEFLSSADDVEIESADDVEISSTPRIILVASDFPKELTTAVLWLNDQGLDIKCVQAIPYKLVEQLLIDISQIIPLKEAADYQVKKAEKAEREREVRDARRRNKNTYNILAEKGVIEQGTVITLLPSVRSLEEENINPEDSRRCAEFTGDGKKVKWKGDGEQHSSLSNLCVHMRDKYGFGFNQGGINGYAYWALEGEDKNLCEKSDEYR